MRDPLITLEFNAIRDQLAELTLSERARAQALELAPLLDEATLRSRMAETTGSRRILDSFGSPPLSSMQEVVKALRLCQAGAMLLPEQLSAVASFLNTCDRMRKYLRRAADVESVVAPMGQSLDPLPDLYETLDAAIVGDTVNEQASPELRRLRRKIESGGEQLRTKLESLLRGKRDWFSEHFVVQRNGRYALPVKREYKSMVPGAVVDISGSGGTYFIEPAQARKLSEELAELRIAEDNEVRRILYELTGAVDAHGRTLSQNVACMETLDFLFAKARLSARMKASEPTLTTERTIVIQKGRHPLLDADRCVPLDFAVGGKVRGVIITGPNTGGKTVALKTVGLLSLMAQSGLHTPAEAGSVFGMQGGVLADIGDGQSIAENLSTFSSHMTNIIAILEATTHESLVLLDELGSGTDPAEGMGLALAILEALRRAGCLFVATSHYPQIKTYAAQAEGLINARMTFDRDSLAPLYALEMGEAGESCALYSAQRLGFPEHLLRHAREVAYGLRQDAPAPLPEMAAPPATPAPSVLRRSIAPGDAPRRCDHFHVGDSVRVYPQKEIGRVYRSADDKGMLGVQVKGKKLLVNHRRVKLLVASEALYPDNYDFDIVFDTVENRKARHAMERKHDPNAIVRYAEEEIHESH